LQDLGDIISVITAVDNNCPGSLDMLTKAEAIPSFSTPMDCKAALLLVLKITQSLALSNTNEVTTIPCDYHYLIAALRQNSSPYLCSHLPLSSLVDINDMRNWR